MSDPYHEGERAVQEQVGERDMALRVGAIMSERIPAKAHEFVSQQIGCVLGAISPDGSLWASYLAGPPGFAGTEDDGARLRLRPTDPAGTLPATPPFERLRDGDQVGVLFIELTTRRRLRVNGAVKERGGEELVVGVSEAFPNCPKYIQRREPFDKVEVEPATRTVREGDALDDELVEWIRGADTFFVASAHRDGRVDVSHRGGEPGFVRLKGQAMHIPDYPGNSMFMTLGNFETFPKAGLTFVDFDRSLQLQLTGDVQLALDRGEIAGETGGTGRWWTFHARRWRVTPLNMPVSWRLIDRSPFNP